MSTARSKEEVLLRARQLLGGYGLTYTNTVLDEIARNRLEPRCTVYLGVRVRVRVIALTL